MKGICFIEPLFIKVITGEKIQTRRIVKPQPDETGESKEFKPRYKLDEVVYLKEPYYPHPRGGMVYKFDHDNFETKVDFKNKRFMPASAAWYFIKITGVRAERLQAIGEKDCLKEGVFKSVYCGGYYLNGITVKRKIEGSLESGKLMYGSPIKAYAALIDSINGKGTWESNPFVWVYDFELTKNPE